MTEFKWADVAHYYANSQILVQCFRGDEVKLGKLIGVDRKSGVYLLFGYDQPSKKQSAGWVDLGWCSPILRHRDDMTEAEARELYAHAEESLKDILGDDYEPPKSYKAEIFKKATHKGTWTFMDHILGNPRDWHKLIEWGFDVFGLIEAGEAIRKEKTT